MTCELFFFSISVFPYSLSLRQLQPSCSKKKEDSLPWRSRALMFSSLFLIVSRSLSIASLDFRFLLLPPSPFFVNLFVQTRIFQYFLFDAPFSLRTLLISAADSSFFCAKTSPFSFCFGQACAYVQTVLAILFSPIPPRLTRIFFPSYWRI